MLAEESAVCPLIHNRLTQAGRESSIPLQIQRLAGCSVGPGVELADFRF